MTPTHLPHRPLDGFEQALLGELRHHVTTRGAAPAPVRPPRRRLAGLAAALVAVASVALGAVLLRPEAAFAVEREADGDVVVTIESLEDADGLERALADHGVEADVSYDAGADPEVVPAPEGKDVPEGAVAGSSSIEAEGASTSADPDRPASGKGLPCGAIGVEMSPEGITFRLPAEAVDSDSVLQIRTAGDQDAWSSVAVQWDTPVCDQRG